MGNSSNPFYVGFGKAKEISWKDLQKEKMCETTLKNMEKCTKISIEIRKNVQNILIKRGKSGNILLYYLLRGVFYGKNGNRAFIRMEK